MTQTTASLLREIGFAVIHFREVYRRWCRERGLSYHELLFSIRFAIWASARRKPSAIFTRCPSRRFTTGSGRCNPGDF